MQDRDRGGEARKDHTGEVRAKPYADWKEHRNDIGPSQQGMSPAHEQGRFALSSPRGNEKKRRRIGIRQPLIQLAQLFSASAEWHLTILATYVLGDERLNPGKVVGRQMR